MKSKLFAYLNHCSTWFAQIVHKSAQTLKGGMDVCVVMVKIVSCLDQWVAEGTFDEIILAAGNQFQEVKTFCQMNKRGQ